MFLCLSLSCSLSLFVISSARSTRWPWGPSFFKLILSFLCHGFKLKPIPKCLKAQTANRLPARRAANPLVPHSTKISIAKERERGRVGGGMIVRWGVSWQLSHNEATGFVSSSEDLVNPELCRAALDRKERPAGAEPLSMTTSFILCHCIQIYYIPNTYHPTAILLSTHRPTLKMDRRGERTHFPLFPKSDWHKLKQRNFLCVSALHNGEHTVKKEQLKLSESKQFHLKKKKL